MAEGTEHADTLFSPLTVLNSQLLTKNHSDTHTDRHRQLTIHEACRAYAHSHTEMSLSFLWPQTSIKMTFLMYISRKYNKMVNASIILIEKFIEITILRG